MSVVQVSGRIEGFEHYLESIFGPKGPLNSKKLQDKIPKMRWPRSASENEILKSQIDKLPNVMKNSFGEPKVRNMRRFASVQSLMIIATTGVPRP